MKPIFVGIAGGSASGKGTVVDAVVKVVKVGDYKGRKIDYTPDLTSKDLKGDTKKRLEDADIDDF